MLHCLGQTGDEKWRETDEASRVSAAADQCYAPLPPAQKPLGHQKHGDAGAIPMMKYLIGLGALVVVVAGYFLLVPAGNPPEPAPAPVAVAPSPEPAPSAIVSQDVATVSPDEEALLEDLAAAAREDLPSAVTEALTMTDALFLPRMRIMEYSYVTTAADARTTARDMRVLIEASAERICLEGRQMFGMGVTLRNSFEDREGNLFQRVYLLPEDCQQFY